MKQTFISLLFIGVCLFNKAHAQVRCGNMSSPVITAQSVTVQSGTTASLSLQWTLVGATLYEVSYRISGTSQYSAGCSTSASNCTVNGLLLGKTYDIRVQASRPCQIVPGEPGEDVTATTISVTLPPAAPTTLSIVAASITTTSFGARWSSSTGATSYRLDVSSSPAFSSGNILVNFSTSATSVNVTGLAPGTTYYFRVRAVNAFGSSGNSAVFSVPTISLAPVNLRATAITQTSFVAQWDASSGATFYRMDVASNPTFASGNIFRDSTVFGTQQLVSGLQPNTTYYFKVRAINNGGVSANSAVFAVTTPVSVSTSAPVITGFTPSSGPAGTAVTISGSNFNTDLSKSAVFFGAVRAIITTAGSTSIIVTVPTGATFEPIRVTDINSHLSAYSARPFITTFTPAGQPFTSSSFERALTFRKEETFASRAADLNNDGKSDLITADGETLLIYENRSLRGNLDSLSFTLALAFTVNQNSSIAMDDLNGDGKPDIVVNSNQFVSIFLNQSSNPAAISFSRLDINTEHQVNSLAVGDLDNDGRPDLALTHVIPVAGSPNATTGGVTVMRNNGGTGNELFLPGVFFQTEAFPVSIAIGDLDNDLKREIVVTDVVTSTMSVLKNTSVTGAITSSSFATKFNFSIGESTNNVVIGDLDGNGIQDLVVGGITSAFVFDNTSASGSFNSSSLAPKVNYAVNGRAFKYVTIHDLNGDGKPEIIGGQSILKNTSAGNSGRSSFDSAVDYFPGEDAFILDVFAGDLDNDGKPDLATTSSGATGYELNLFHNNLVSDNIPDVYLTTPASGATGYLPKVDVVAKSVSGASTYTIQLSSQQNFSADVIEKSGVRGQEFTGLSYGTHYFARVKTDLSPAYGKTTEFSTVPVEDLSFVISPENGAIDQSPNLTISCNSVPDATQYTIQLSTTPFFTTPYIEKTGGRAQNFTGLNYNTTYYSRVRTEFSANWGETRSFTVGDASTFTYVLSPANGASDLPVAFDLICSQVPGASQFTVRIIPANNDNTFTFTFTSTSRTVHITGLTPNTLYIANVKTNLSSQFGPASTFSTGAPASITAESAALVAYPNPASDKVTISNIKPGSRIKIVDPVLGTIEWVKTSNDELTFETTKYRKGFYYIVQVNADGSETESLKLLIN